MSLQYYWDEISKLNGYDKLPSEDQAILKETYFSGAVAFYGEFMSTNANQTQLVAEFESFMDAHRTNATSTEQGPAISFPGRRNIRISRKNGDLKGEATNDR